jgi:hypothetical protein
MNQKTILKVELFVLKAIFSSEKKHPHGLTQPERAWHYINYHTVPAHVEELAGTSSRFIYTLLRQIQVQKADSKEIHRLITACLSERSHSSTATDPALAESSRRIQQFAQKIHKMFPSDYVPIAPAAGASR